MNQCLILILRFRSDLPCVQKEMVFSLFSCAFEGVRSAIFSVVRMLFLYAISLRCATYLL